MYIFKFILYTKEQIFTPPVLVCIQPAEMIDELDLCNCIYVS